MSGTLSVIIPLRNRHGGKTRLSDRFTPEDRAQLVHTMAETVLDAVLEAGIASQIVVVTIDPVFVQEVIADRTGIRIVHQPARFAGLHGALERGRDAAISASTLFLFADLPMISPSDLVEAANADARVVLLPDRHHIGTNGLLIRDDPDGEFSFQFGENSFSRHLQEAQRLHWSVAILDNPGTATDLDTMHDWQELPIQERKRFGITPRALFTHGKALQ